MLESFLAHRNPIRESILSMDLYVGKQKDGLRWLSTSTRFA